MPNESDVIHSLGGSMVVIGIVGPFLTFTGMGLGIGVTFIIIGIILMCSGKSKGKVLTKKQRTILHIASTADMPKADVERCLSEGDEGIKKIVYYYLDHHYSFKKLRSDNNIVLNNLTGLVFMDYVFDREFMSKIHKYEDEYIKEGEARERKALEEKYLHKK